MLYSCSPASTATGGARNSSTGSKRFAVDLHCHVFTPDAETIVAEVASGDLFTFINDATREVNRKMMAAIADRLVSVDARRRPSTIESRKSRASIPIDSWVWDSSNHCRHPGPR